MRLSPALGSMLDINSCCGSMLLSELRLAWLGSSFATFQVMSVSLIKAHMPPAVLWLRVHGELGRQQRANLMAVCASWFDTVLLFLKLFMYSYLYWQVVYPQSQTKPAFLLCLTYGNNIYP